MAKAAATAITTPTSIPKKGEISQRTSGIMAEYAPIAKKEAWAQEICLAKPPIIFQADPIAAYIITLKAISKI